MCCLESVIITWIPEVYNQFLEKIPFCVLLSWKYNNKSFYENWDIWVNIVSMFIKNTISACNHCYCKSYHMTHMAWDFRECLKPYRSTADLESSLWKIISLSNRFFRDSMIIYWQKIHENLWKFMLFWEIRNMKMYAVISNRRRCKVVGWLQVAFAHRW